MGRAPPARGVIELEGGAAGTIELVDGRIALATAEDGPTLAQMVIGSGAISSDGWDTAQAAAGDEHDLVDALLDGGADADLLQGALREQTVGALFEFLVPGETTFAYRPQPAGGLGGRFAFDPDRRPRRGPGAASRPGRSSPRPSPRPRWSCASAARSTAHHRRSPPTTGASSPSSTDARSWPTSSASLGMSAFAVCGVLHRLMTAGAVEAAA